MEIKGFQDTIAWYDQNAEQYAEPAVDFSVPEELDEFAHLLFAGATVLDAGCGGGRDTALLTNRGLRVTGFDLSKGLIEAAQKRHPDLPFIHGDMRDMPFGPNSFDGVWSRASLVHMETIDDVKRALQEFCRVLKLNGIVHILVKAQTGNEKTAIISDSLSTHERFFQYFKQDEIMDLLIDTGFDVIRIEQYNEIKKISKGRPEVEVIVALAKKKVSEDRGRD